MHAPRVASLSLALTLAALGSTVPSTAGTVFVLVGNDGQSLLTAELQSGNAVITSTQALTPTVGSSTFPVVTYADDPSNPFNVYALRNDNVAIITADATDGGWTNGSYGTITGGAYDDIAYDSGQSQMYGTALAGASLWRINGPTSGDQVQVGVFANSGAFQEIAVDESTGQMYGTDLGGTGLYTINKSDATWVKLADFTAQGSGTPGAFNDLTFTLDGQLYGMNTTEIYEINKVTGVYSPPFPIVDLNNTPVTVAGHFAAVPEPGTLAVLGCGLTTVVIGLRSAARRVARNRARSG